MVDDKILGEALEMDLGGAHVVMVPSEALPVASVNGKTGEVVLTPPDIERKTALSSSSNKVDLNDVTAPGMYEFIRADIVFSYVLNSPTKENDLEYLHVDEVSDTEIQQTVVCVGGAPVYRRQRSGGIWTEWVIVSIEHSAFNSHPIDPSTVGAMFRILESYAEQALTPNGEISRLVYGGSSSRVFGLYCTDLAGANNPEGQYSICCAQFVDAVVNAIPWPNSRYVLGKNARNIRLPWGYQYDDAVSYRDSERDDVRVTERYLTASRIPEYAMRHGFFAVNDGVFQPMPGDVFCTAPSDPKQWSSWAYRHIGHVGIVLSCDSVVGGNGFCYCAEAWPTKKVDGSAAGIRFHRYALSEIDSFIRFPIGGANTAPTLLKTITEFPKEGIGSLYSASPEDRTGLFNKRGFYTIQVNFSSAPSTSAERNVYFGVRYPDDTEPGAETRTVALSRCGRTYYGVVYLEQPAGPLLSITLPNNMIGAVSAESVKIYRGFAPLETV